MILTSQSPSMSFQAPKKSSNCRRQRQPKSSVAAVMNSMIALPVVYVRRSFGQRHDKRIGMTTLMNPYEKKRCIVLGNDNQSVELGGMPFSDRPEWIPPLQEGNQLQTVPHGIYHEGRLRVHSMLAVLPQKWTMHLLEDLTLSDSGPMNLFDSFSIPPSFSPRAFTVVS